MTRLKRAAVWAAIVGFLLGNVLAFVPVPNGAQRGSRGTGPAITPSPAPHAWEAKR